MEQPRNEQEMYPVARVGVSFWREAKSSKNYLPWFWSVNASRPKNRNGAVCKV